VTEVLTFNTTISNRQGREVREHSYKEGAKPELLQTKEKKQTLHKKVKRQRRKREKDRYYKYQEEGKSTRHGSFGSGKKKTMQYILTKAARAESWKMKNILATRMRRGLYRTLHKKKAKRGHATWLNYDGPKCKMMR